MGDDEDEGGDGDDEEQDGRRPHVHRHRAREEGVPTEEEEVRAVNFELILDWLLGCNECNTKRAVEIHPVSFIRVCENKGRLLCLSNSLGTFY